MAGTTWNFGELRKWRYLKLKHAMTRWKQKCINKMKVEWKLYHSVWIVFCALWTLNGIFCCRSLSLVQFFFVVGLYMDLFHFCLGISIRLQFYVGWLNVTSVSNKPHFGKYLYVFFCYFVYFPCFFLKWSLNVTTRLLFLHFQKEFWNTKCAQKCTKRHYSTQTTKI